MTRQARVHLSGVPTLPIHENEGTARPPTADEAGTATWEPNGKINLDAREFSTAPPAKNNGMSRLNRGVNTGEHFGGVGSSGRSGVCPEGTAQSSPPKLEVY